MSSDAIILNSRIWVPADYVSKGKTERHFHPVVYVNRHGCQTCEYVDESPCAACNQCDNFVGDFKLYRVKTIEDVQYIGFPFGSATLLKNLWPELRELNAIDERVAPKFRYAADFEFNWDLYDYQKEAVDFLAKKKIGVLKSAPRSGKTVMAVALAVKLGLKVLILASQDDWLDQFLTIFDEATNIRDIEKAEGKRLCGKPKTEEDYGKLPILLCTYQSFLSDGNGRRRLKACAKSYGVLIVDETHQTAATRYAQIISKFQSRYRIGLTGTPDRKDKLYEAVIDKVMGPVVHETEVETLVPKVRFTQSKFTKSYRTWTPFIRALSQDEARNTLIVDLVEHYLKQGRHIVIPCYHIEHVNNLVKFINQRMGRRIAAAFTGQLKKSARNNERQTLLAKARSGRIKVTVGIRKIVQTGINVPLWDTIIEVMPISNPPQFHQEYSRILTPIDGKPHPIVHHIYDQVGISLGCLRTCLFKSHVPEGHKMRRGDYEEVVARINGLRPTRASTDDYQERKVKKLRAEHGRRPDRQKTLTGRK